MTGNRWSLSFFPKEVAFGILTVLLPLYIIEEINGNLLDIGLIFFVKSFVQIPAVILWARLVNKEGKCKSFITLSFLISSLAIFLFSFTRSTWSLLALNVLLSVFYVAHMPATRILIAESSPNLEWEGGFAWHKLVLGVGGIAGLLAGALWTARLDNRSMMILCSVLVAVSLILSVALIQDPPFMIERKIMRFEHFVHLAEQADNLAYAPNDRARVQARETIFSRYPNPKPLILGILFFPLASSMVFTSIPVFLTLKIGASSSQIFSILLINSIMILLGYTLIRKNQNRNNLKMIKTASLLSIVFPMLILISGFLNFNQSLTLCSLALAIAGFTWSYFSVSSTVLWMETAPKGKAGIYNACSTLGTALGSLMAGFISSYYGYDILFVLSATVFGMALFLFAFSHSRHSNNYT